MSGWRTLGLFVAVATALYAGLVALMYSKQRSLLFYPQFTRHPPVASDFQFDHDGATLRGWVVNPGRRRALLYFGGNGEDVSLNRDDALDWTPDHTVYLVSYRGYGHSDGEPSEAALAADAIALFDLVARTHEEVDVLGRSLGSGVAVHVAAVRPVRRLALVTPFDSVLRVGQGHYPWVPLAGLLKDPFESWRRAPKLGMPTLVVIAGQDNVTPPAHADALIGAMPRAPDVLRLGDAQHSNVQVFPEYEAALRRFFSSD
jgi:pimeloyl-ACP methyl ester carboxylesterase